MKGTVTYRTLSVSLAYISRCRGVLTTKTRTFLEELRCAQELDAKKFLSDQG